MTSSHQRATSGALFILILSGLMAFTSLSTDIYLPAMPMMAAQLHGDAELTITGFLIGFALAQLVWGPISDRLGRRTPLFIGMVLFIIGSAGCTLSTTIDQIVFWRVFQALGACTGPMLAPKVPLTPDQPFERRNIMIKAFLAAAACWVLIFGGLSWLKDTIRTEEDIDCSALFYLL